MGENEREKVKAELIATFIAKLECRLAFLPAPGHGDWSPVLKSLTCTSHGLGHATFIY